VTSDPLRELSQSSLLENLDRRHLFVSYRLIDISPNDKDFFKATNPLVLFLLTKLKRALIK
jgi:hypothetical protein